MRTEMQRGGKNAGKSGRELWLQALKEGKGNLASGRKSGNPGHKTEMEYWSGNLRKNGDVNEARVVDSFTGLKNTRARDMSYLSTSHFLRQSAGYEKPTPRNDPMVKTAMGTPAYKSQEEYYEEVIALKKQIISAKDEADTLKSKIRRLEEENLKKEKQLEQLLDPTKNEELRRTLGDRKADAAIVIQSLKQKIFKLEQQMKDKDAAYNKISTDLKSTKMEEMKVQLEVLYTEVLRLRHAAPVDIEYARQAAEMAQSPTASQKENAAKIDALSKTVKKLNEDKTKLATENKTLKEDLQRMMDDQDQKDNVKKDYEDMNRRQLLQNLSRLEAKVKRMEDDSSSENRPARPFTTRSGDGPVDTENKVALEGNLRERLDQLDKRESELLGEIQTQKKTVERLKEDRQHYKVKYEEKSKEVTLLDEKLARLSREFEEQGMRYQATAGTRGRESPSPRPRGKKSPSDTDSRSGRSSRGPSSREVEAFREKHAATVIQREWRKHRDYEEENEATEVIQSALRGYNNRENFLKRRESSPPERSRRSGSIPSGRRTSASSDDGESIEFLQSAVRGYNARNRQLRRMKDEDEESIQSRRSSSFARKFDGEDQPTARPRSSGSRTGSISRSTSSRAAGREGTQVGRIRPSTTYGSTDDGDDGYF